MTGEVCFGDWVRHARKQLGWTQAELAERVGCATATIRQLEAEERRPSPEVAALLAEALVIPAGQRALFVTLARRPFGTTVLLAPAQESAPPIAGSPAPVSTTPPPTGT